jgi:DNA-binding CsgD family transcriptional regulator
MRAHPADAVSAPDSSGDAHLEAPDPTFDLRLAARRSALAFAIVAALAGGDLLSDTRSGIALGHVALEGAMLVVALGGIAVLWRAVRRTGRQVRALHGVAEAARAEADRWRRQSRSLLAGLGAAIDLQFERWGLSPAEREVALLLVKGLSSQEIATVRATSERTVRQQSQAVYRKAGLAGRAELAAFFLEDLLLPDSLSEMGG